MFKLIQLEFKKNRLSSYLKGVLIANFIIAFFVIGVALLERSEGFYAFETYEEAFILINALIQMTFVVFASVLIAKLVIEEYKNKTITVMFAYPISRKKLLIAKLFIVFSFTFVSIILSNIVVTAAFLFLAEQFALVPDLLNQQFLNDNIRSVLINTLAASGISLIPVYFGMLKKSVPTTIVSGFLIIAVVTSNTNGFSLGSYIVVPLTLACLGLFLTYLSIRNVDKADVV